MLIIFANSSVGSDEASVTPGIFNPRSQRRRIYPFTAAISVWRHTLAAFQARFALVKRMNDWMQERLDWTISSLLFPSRSSWHNGWNLAAWTNLPHSPLPRRRRCWCSAPGHSGFVLFCARCRKACLFSPQAQPLVLICRDNNLLYLSPRHVRLRRATYVLLSNLPVSPAPSGGTRRKADWWNLTSRRCCCETAHWVVGRSYQKRFLMIIMCTFNRTWNNKKVDN